MYVEDEPVGRKRRLTTRYTSLSLLLLLLCAASAVPARGAGAQSACNQDLRRGINLNGWLNAQPNAKIVQAAPSDAELANLRRLGVTFARIPFDPLQLTARDRHAAHEPLTRLHEALDRVQAVGLTVVVDPHPPGAVVERILGDTAVRAEHSRALVSVASHLAQHFPCAVLELLNEPHGRPSSGHSWPMLQSSLLEQVRQVAPRLTVALTGDDWSSPAGLLRLSPVADPRVVYTFHYYRPAAFTFQGAFWEEFATTVFPHLDSLPYPVEPTRADSLVHASLSRVPSDAAVRAAVAALVRGYAEGGWGRSRIRAELAEIGAWARSHRVRVYLGEFGAWSNRVDPISHRNWITDVRESAEAENLGWALWQFWDYGQGFGLLDRDRRVSPTIAGALGLAEQDQR